MIKIIIKNSSIVTEDVDAIVNPANSGGYMGGGVAGALKKMGGEEIENEAISEAPINIGVAVLTISGDLTCGYIIHAPTMENPSEKTDTHKIKCAVEAALELADAKEFIRIAMPGMGTGVGMVNEEESAEIMIKTIKEFKPKFLKEVRLVDTNDEMTDAWEKYN